MRSEKGRLKKRLQYLAEHGVVVALTILVAFLIAMATILGIYGLNWAEISMFGKGTSLVSYLVDYSGFEAGLIFIISSVSLIRFMLSEEESEVSQTEGV